MLLICSAVSLWATEEQPTLVILTTTSGEVQIPIASIQKITYNQATQDSMYVNTVAGVQTYALDQVIRMTLTNVPEPTSIDEVSTTDADTTRKVMIGGTVYILRDNKLFTIKGETIQ